MEVLNEFFTRLSAKDAPGLSELFAPEATFDDASPSGMFALETHLIGKEAIDMHFSNRFVFRTYLCTGFNLTDSLNGTADLVVTGKPSRANVSITALTPEGKIQSMTLTPVA